jgi:hypothetical protein
VGVTISVGWSIGMGGDVWVWYRERRRWGVWVIVRERRVTSRGKVEGCWGKEVGISGMKPVIVATVAGGSVPRWTGGGE